MNKRLRAPITAILLIALFMFVFGLLSRFGYIGNSARRVAREHGLKVPASAHKFVCGGDAWLHPLMDSGAASAFVMESRDLAGFTSQLQIREAHDGNSSVFPTNSRYQIQRPWKSGVVLKTYLCASRTEAH